MVPFLFLLILLCNRVIILLHSLFDMPDCKKTEVKTLKNFKKSIDIVDGVGYNKNIKRYTKSLGGQEYERYYS